MHLPLSPRVNRAVNSLSALARAARLASSRARDARTLYSSVAIVAGRDTRYQAEARRLWRVVEAADSHAVRLAWRVTRMENRAYQRRARG